MKKIFLIFAIGALLCSCEEFEPVVTVNYGKPAANKGISGEFQTIAGLVSTYKHENPIPIMYDGKMICGRVSTTDKPGNFYKSLYIQDETGGIEVKIGRNALYNEYKPGQMVYVICDGLALGEYGYKSGKNGMVQIGFNGEGTDYETSYMELPLIIDSHVIPGDPDDIQPVQPAVLTEDQLPSATATQATNSYLGKKVTLKDLTYGGVDSYKTKTEVFTLLYLDSNQNKKLSSNRIFISGTGTGVNTWAMSKNKMTEYICSGIWDNVQIGNANDYNYGKVGDLRGEDGTYPSIEKAAASVSQYFSTAGGTLIAIRTSGYCKFADVEIPDAVLKGQQKIDVTGVLTLYQGGIQIVVNDISDIKFK